MKRLLIISSMLYLAVLSLATSCGNMPTEENGGKRPPISEWAPPSYYSRAQWGPQDLVLATHQPFDDDGNPVPGSGIWVMNADGTDQRSLLNYREEAYFPEYSWSPDGQWIALSAGQDGQVYKMTLAKDSTVQLTSETTVNVGTTWSPDGRWIASAAIDGTREERGLWLVDADGKAARPFKRPALKDICLNCPTVEGFGPIWFAEDPDWSPQGGEIAYVAFENIVGNVHLALYDTTTARVQFIHRAKTAIRGPQFSPDGSKIAFYTDPDEEREMAVWVINRDGSGLRRLTRGGGKSPTWSPDGRQLVYTKYSYTAAEDEPGIGQLWVMNADGSGKKQLTY